MNNQDIPPDNKILFFERDRDEFGFLSNFNASNFHLDGRTWPTSEHYYQAQKSTNNMFLNTIYDTELPGKVKRFARRWLEENPSKRVDRWWGKKVEVMEKAVQAKFLQNPDLMTMLLNTYSAELMEDSSHDCFWGTGKDGSGKNMLGNILMELRKLHVNNV